VDNATKLLRNQSTRDLWDPNYISQSWIRTNVTLIPRLQGWVQEYYPGTKVQYYPGTKVKQRPGTKVQYCLYYLGTKVQYYQGIELCTASTVLRVNVPQMQVSDQFMYSKSGSFRKRDSLEGSLLALAAT
jgi:hypothetical protein